MDTTATKPDTLYHLCVLQDGTPHMVEAIPEVYHDFVMYAVRLPGEDGFTFVHQEDLNTIISRDRKWERNPLFLIAQERLAMEQRHRKAMDTLSDMSRHYRSGGQR